MGHGAIVRRVKLAKAKLRKVEVVAGRQRAMEELISSVSSGFELTQDPSAAWALLSQTTLCMPVASPQGPCPKGKLRCVCISDTHGQHEHVQLPPGDILLHAGDFTEAGEMYQIRSFCDWLHQQPFTHKVVVAGNHDVLLDQAYYDRVGYSRFHERRGLPKEDPGDAKLLLRTCCTYLENNVVDIAGLRIFGSPFQPAFMDWAFGLERGEALRKAWEVVPENVDIVLVHGPPVGFGDLTKQGDRVGCVDLLRELQQRVKPQFAVYGHIHEGYGTRTDGRIVFLNAASCGRGSREGVYEIQNVPLIFDIDVPAPACV